MCERAARRCGERSLGQALRAPDISRGCIGHEIEDAGGQLYRQPALRRHRFRLEDLGLGDLVQLECACGRTAVLTPAMLRTAGVEPVEKVVDLESRFRCGECDARGKTAVSLRWER